MTTLILTRHGHVEGITPARFRGRVEVPLSAHGEAQAAAVAARISSRFAPVAVYTSELERCRVTGGLIAAACGVASDALEGLADIHYGDWQWQTLDEVAQAHAEAYALWRSAPQFTRFPNGESLQDVLVRVADAVRLVLARHAGEQVVLVGHDSVNRVLLCHLLDLPLSAYWRLAQDPCNLTVLDLSGQTARLVQMNDTAHLEAIRSA